MDIKIFLLVLLHPATDQGCLALYQVTPAEDICWVDDAIVVVVVPPMSAILVTVDWTPVVCVSVTTDAVVVGGINGGCRPDSFCGYHMEYVLFLP